MCWNIWLSLHPQPQSCNSRRLYNKHNAIRGTTTATAHMIFGLSIPLPLSLFIGATKQTIRGKLLIQRNATLLWQNAIHNKLYEILYFLIKNNKFGSASLVSSLILHNIIGILFICHFINNKYHN